MDSITSTPEATQDTNERQSKGIVIQQSPGFKAWHGKSKLASGGDLVEMSKYDLQSAEWAHLVGIGHDDAFTLQPITVTDGSLQGHHALILRPITAVRFADLPAELRSMVYRYLVEETRPIRLASYKVIRKDRRPVREGFPYINPRPELGWDKNAGKWIGRTPSNFSIMRVSRQLLQEVAPIVYADNKFEFYVIDDMGVFLSTIGSMRRYIKHIKFSSISCLTYSDARRSFNFLKDALNLHTITLDHRELCSPTESRLQPTGFDCFIKDIRPFVKKLHSARKATDSSIDILHMFCITWQICRACEARPKTTCSGREPDCYGTCHDADKHCKHIEARIRTSLMQILKIQG